MIISPIKPNIPYITTGQMYNRKTNSFPKTCPVDNVNFAGKPNNNVTKKIIIIIGAPNSGKGIVSKALSEHLGLPCINCGDIIRNRTKQNKNFGGIIEKFAEKLGSKPKYTELLKFFMYGFIKKCLKLPPYRNGAVIEGFPRSIEEADMLKDILCKERNLELKIVHLDVDKPLLYERSAKRFVCDECNKTYSLESITGLTKCECGGNIVKRADDTPEILDKRIHKYETETLPLIDYYGDKVVSIPVRNNKTSSNEILGKIISAISE